MSIDLSAAMGFVSSKKSKSKKSKNGARVTSGVVAQVEANGLGQACIALHSSNESKRFALYRGPVNVEVNGTSHTLTKTDSHSAWLSKQGENLEGFVNLYNLLSASPNEFKGEVNAVNELPELPEEVEDQA